MSARLDFWPEVLIPTRCIGQRQSRRFHFECRQPNFYSQTLNLLPHDTDGIGREKRFPQSAEEPAYNIEHCLFHAAFDLVVEHLSRVLSRPRHAAIHFKADYPSSGVSGILSTGLLPREDPRGFGRSTCCTLQ